VLIWRGAQRQSAARRLRPCGRGATADVPAGTVAMDHVPTRPSGLGDTAGSTAAPTWARCDYPTSQLGPWRWIVCRRDRRASVTLRARRLRPRLDEVGAAPLPTSQLGPWDQHLSWGGDARILVDVRDPLQRTKTLFVVVGPVGAVGKRAPGWPGVWCAVVQGRRATTFRAHAFRRHVRVVVLGPAASTGHLARAPRSRSGDWCPCAGTRRASTQPPRRTDLLRLASIAETAWAVENLINSDPLTLTDRHWG
jgi:hypothetical protein